MRVLAAWIMTGFFIVVPTSSFSDGVWQKYLNGNNIRDITVNGTYVWSATDGGLVRWDKSDGSFRHYIKDDGLLSNQLDVVSIAQDNSLWVGYEDERNKNRVSVLEETVLRTLDSSDKGVSNHRIQSIFFDREGLPWLGTAWGGIVRYDGSEWITYLPQEVFDKAPRKIVIDDNGVKWIATSDGVWTLDKSAWKKYTTGDGLVNDSVNDISVDSTGALWFGTSGGVSRFDGAAWESYTKDDGLVNNIVNTLTVDHNDVLWIGTDYGVSRFDGTSWITFTESNELIDNRITSITEDTDNNMWFCHAGAGRGVTLYDGTDWIWYTIWNTGIPSNDVRAAVSDREGILWFATDTGLARFDGTDWTTFATDDGLMSYAVSDIFVDESNTKWIVYERFEGMGVTRFDGREWVTFTEKDGLPTSTVTAVAEDIDGTMCFGTTKGFSQYDGAEWIHYPSDNRLISPNIFDIAQDSKGVLWFATAKGISRFDGASWWTYSTGEAVQDDIVSLEIDKNDTIWCLTSYGWLMSFDGELFTTHLVEGEGVPKDADIRISCFDIDSNGIIWTDAVTETWYDEEEELWKKNICSYDGTS